jgi:outer membrane protein assembly factor BamB
VPDAPKYLDGWRMVGANPERTSWVPSGSENQTAIPGQLKLEWYKPFEPFIWQKVQIIAADGLLYVATARGLYALDAETGDER